MKHNKKEYKKLPVMFSAGQYRSIEKGYSVAPLVSYCNLQRSIFVFAVISIYLSNVLDKYIHSFSYPLTEQR